MSTVYRAFADTATAHADKHFLHIPHSAATAWADTDVNLDYGEALESIHQLAEHYRSAGYGPAQRVALALENRPDFFLHWLALNRLGCSVIPISLEMQDEEIRYFLEHGDAALVIAIPEALDRLNAVCSSAAAPPVVAADNTAGLPAVNSQHGDAAPDNGTECALLYTSGSTGKPKACMLDNDYFLFAGQWYNGLGGLTRIRPGQERLLTPLPLTHMNAMAVSSMAMILSGGCLIQLDRFHPSSWWETVRETGATIIHYLGVLPAILLEMPDSGNDTFGDQVRFGFGAGVNPRHHARFEERFGFPLIEAWAMTESGVGGSIIANHEPRHVGTCCFGKPPAGLEVQLVDEAHRTVTTGEPGELRVRAAGKDPARGFFRGYLKNAEATAEIWQDGWLNTGDVVRQGPDGSLHFVDRRKNVIRRSGENISALEVEAALALHPAVGNAVATAVPDELRGDEVAACIVLTEGNAADAALARAIVERCLQQLAYYKAPGYILFCRDLPVTASNKPRRADIKQLARDRVALGDCIDTRELKRRRPAQWRPAQ
ncbi:MAG: AMP-binding protein [Chromatocurvus sp.]